MTEYDAYKAFQDKAKGPVNEVSFTAVFRQLVSEVEVEWNKDRKPGQRKPKYSNVVAHALSLMLGWYEDGLASNLPDSPLAWSIWIASYRPGYCWAKTLRHAHEALPVEVK